MIMNIYCFYDKKSQETINPTFFKNDDLIKRDVIKIFKEQVKNAPFYDFPEDFDLFHIGFYNTNCVALDKIENLDKPRFVCNVAELKKE